MVTGCEDPRPPLPPNQLIPGWVIFSPIRLSTETGRYQIKNNNGVWTDRFTTHTFQDFYEIFDMPTSYGGNHRHASSIKVTSNYGSSSSASRTYNDKSNSGVKSNELEIDVYNDSNLENFRNQSLDIEIHSGLYRCANSLNEGKFIWNMRLLARDMGINNIVNTSESEPMIWLGYFNFSSNARFLRIVDNSSGGNSNNSCSCHNGKPALSGGQMYFCDCLQPFEIDNGFIHTFDDSRFTEIEWAGQDNNGLRTLSSDEVLIVPVQTGDNEGVLTVFATQETYNSLR